MVVFREHSESCASSMLESDFSDDEGCSTLSTVLTRQNGVKVEGIYRATSVRMGGVPVRAVTKDGKLAVSRISPKFASNDPPAVPAIPVTLPARTVTQIPRQQQQPEARESQRASRGEEPHSSLSSGVSSNFSTPTSQQTHFTIPTPPQPVHLVSPLSPEQSSKNGFQYGERGARSSTALPYDPMLRDHIVQHAQHQEAPSINGRMGLTSPTPSDRSIAKESAVSGFTGSSRSGSQRRYGSRAGTRAMDERMQSPMMESYEENVLVEKRESIMRHAQLAEKVPTSPANLLSTLWEVAEGATNYQYPGIFVLNIYQRRLRDTTMYVDQPEHFLFGTDRETDFYTLQALPQFPYSKTCDELVLHRRNPYNYALHPVLQMTLPAKLPPVDRIDPVDPSNPDILITYLYPTAIINEAVTQAAQVSKETADFEQAQIESNKALQNALSREGCRLSWDSSKRRYYLFCPGVGERGDVFLIAIEGRVGFGLRAKGNIKLLDVDQGDTIACVDFATGQLFVDCRACAKVPNRHFVDIAVATILVVCTVEGRRYRPFEAPPVAANPNPAEAQQAPTRSATVGPTRKPVPAAIQRRNTMYTMKGKTPKEPKWTDPFVAVGKGSVKVVKALAFGIIFAVGLGFEILKAIFDAFRPLPKEEGRERDLERGQDYPVERGGKM